MGILRVLGFRLLLALPLISLAPGPLWGQGEPDELCAAAIEKYQQTHQSFQALSRECLEEAGIAPQATLEDCPSVDKRAFISLIAQMERDHELVCQDCEGVWPQKILGLGSCWKKE